MALWFILALMTAFALVAVFWPFVVRAEPVKGSGEVAVYTDQLSEIDRDLQAGLIERREAGAARVEVSRRLLQAADDTTRYAVPLAAEPASTRKLALLAIAAVFLPVLAGSLYLHLGSPMAASILSATEPSETDSNAALVESMVNQVESYLKEASDDGRGWETLAPIYMRMGRYDDAIRAWQNAIANLGDDIEREESLGESFVAAGSGIVTKKARDAFDRVRSMDPNNVTARFYAGLAAKQDGRRDEAARLWRDLIAEAPPDAEWADTVLDALAQLDVPPAAGSGQSLGEDQIAIKQMVDSLAERLKTDSRDVDGWIRLVQSYNVLGDRAKVEAAIADARKALAADPGKLARLEAGSTVGNRPAEREPEGQVSARAVPPEHQNATVRAMVDGLAERLGKDGGDPDRWFMLIRSYETLGEQKEAEAATARAKTIFASDPEKLSYLNQLLRKDDDAPSNVSTLNSAPPVAKDPSVAAAPAAEAQMTMIRGMVDRLAERLEQNGHDVDGWTQLIRSYVVLGQRDQAAAATEKARTVLSHDADAIRRVVAAAKDLGIVLP
jgi:cytochrome c-type biogenesis protein CcmH